jgi:hypothetical protein
MINASARRRMKTFDVQGVELAAPFDTAFSYISEPRNLPNWTRAFKAVSDGKALLETDNGAVEIQLLVAASRERGTIDWIMGFPDGSTAVAYSRVVDIGKYRSIYSFVLLPPPVPLEQLEGTLAKQSEILREELAKLRSILHAGRR